jgi:hypothetical protein
MQARQEAPRLDPQQVLHLGPRLVPLPVPLLVLPPGPRLAQQPVLHPVRRILSNPEMALLRVQQVIVMEILVNQNSFGDLVERMYRFPRVHYL